jgi:Bifunctional DNA primase/polymerase, N-terminal
MQTLRSITEAALEYISQGLAVYPTSAEKKPLIKRWNSNGAFCDADKALRYFEEHPEAQLGIACGPSKSVVCDIDPRNNGEASWQVLCKTIGIETFEGCPVSLTPGGGQHIWFRAPAEETLKVGSHALGSGVDVIAAGGGVLVPPSRRPEGLYRWRTPDGLQPDFTEMPTMPPVLIRQLRRKSLERTTDVLARRISHTIPRGCRNDALMRMGSKIHWRESATKEELSVMLLVLNKRCVPPLSDEEVLAIAESVAKRGVASVDPAKWLNDWIPKLRTLQELRVAATLAMIAEFATGPLTPSAALITERSGMRKENYHRIRRQLEQRGMLRVIRHAPRSAPTIVLLERDPLALGA